MNDYLTLGIAVFSTLSPVVGFFIWWIRRLYRELQESRDKLDPALELERKNLCVKLNLEQEQNRELNTSIRNADKRIGSLQNELTKRTHRSKEYLDKAKQLQRIAIQYRDSSTRLQQQLNETNARIQSQLAELRQSKDLEWEAQLDEIKNQWTVEVDGLTKDGKELDDRLTEKIEEGEKQLKKIQDLDDQLDDRIKREESILRREGRIWEPVVPKDAPIFVSLSNNDAQILKPRSAPIISVLNLKGGVGKTTLTANLAATLGHPDCGQRVLVMDLDFQRSLTQLCCKADQIRVLHEKELCIQHFFLRRDPGDGQSSTSLSRELFKSCSKVHRKGTDLFEIIACSEDFEKDQISASLDDTEMHMFAEWLIGGFATDIRFRLRDTLQSDIIQQRFDYVFLDCPPRLSLASINALAASDFVLVPVIPDEMSIASVPLLLKKIDRLRRIDGLLSSLKILGVVANKVRERNGELIDHQADAWNKLPKFCQIARENSPYEKEFVYFFKQKISYNAEFGNAAGAFDPDFAVSGHANIRGWFSNLIQEIEMRVEDERSSTTRILE